MIKNIEITCWVTTHSHWFPHQVFGIKRNWLLFFNVPQIEQLYGIVEALDGIILSSQNQSVVFYLKKIDLQ